MLTRVARDASDYLERNYDVAVAEVTRNRNEALAKRKAAAAQGDVTAQLALGTMYSTGRDLDRDDQKAAMWWRKAAEQVDSNAQLYLASAYAAGRGVQQDDKEAIAWLERSADHGNAPADSARTSRVELKL